MEHKDLFSHSWYRCPHLGRSILDTDSAEKINAKHSFKGEAGFSFKKYLDELRDSLTIEADSKYLASTSFDAYW